MKCFIRRIKTPVVPAIVCLTFPEMADPCYLDMGGVILPWIVAALVGASVTIVMYWRKIKAFFVRHFQKGKTVKKDNDSAEE